MKKNPFQISQILHFTFRNLEHFYTHPSLQMDHISCEVREASTKMQDHHFDMEPSLMQIFFSQHSRSQKVLLEGIIQG